VRGLSPSDARQALTRINGSLIKIKASEAVEGQELIIEVREPS